MFNPANSILSQNGKENHKWPEVTGYPRVHCILQQCCGVDSSVTYQCVINWDEIHVIVIVQQQQWVVAHTTASVKKEQRE